MEKSNYAFIDQQNLYLAVRDLGWELDYRKFRFYLKEKYNVTRAYMFIGYIPSYKGLYYSLQSKGFVLIFKPVLAGHQYKIKGNCDAELVLQAMVDINDYDQAILITGDGDFYCLIKYLVGKDKLRKVLAPSVKNCSLLLKRLLGNRLSFVSGLKQKIEYKRKEAHKD